MISSLLKQVMKECELNQTGLAEVLEVSIDRVKSLTSGRVKKLTREENEALIKKLNIRGDWLATGEGPMFRSDNEREFQRRLDALKDASEKAGNSGLDTAQQRLLQEILFYAEAGKVDELAKLLVSLAPDEAALVDNYRHCPPEGKAALKTTSNALAQPKCGKKAG